MLLMLVFCEVGVLELKILKICGELYRLLGEFTIRDPSKEILLLILD